MKSTLKYFAVLWLILLIFATGVSWAFRDTGKISFSGGFLSVHVEQVQLSELLLNLEKATGVRFQFEEAVGKREISLDFSEVSLLEGIKKITHPLSYAVIWVREKKIHTVIILTEGKDQNTPAQLEASRSSSTKFKPSKWPEEPLGSNNPSVVSGRDDQATARDDSVPSTGPPGFEKHVDEGPSGAHDKFAKEPPDLEPPPPPHPLEPSPGTSPTYDVRGPPGYEKNLEEGPLGDPPDS